MIEPLHEPDWSRIDGVLFKHGAHHYADGAFCAMEGCAKAWGLRHTDQPEALDERIGPQSVSALIRSINDAPVWGSDEQRTEALKPRLVRLHLAARGIEADRQRAYIAAHFAACRAADAMESIGRADLAKRLRVIPRPTNYAGCIALRSAARGMSDEGRRTCHAARAAARSADDAARAADAAREDDAAAYAAYAAYAAADAAADAADAADAAQDADARREALLSMLDSFLDVTVPS